LVLLIIGLWPWRYLAFPRWEVWVIDNGGNPVPGICARLVYVNYSTENQGHEITLTTDENVHALFAPQYERADFLRWAFYTALSARGGVHASFGRSAYVFVFGKGYEGQAVSGKYVADWSGYPEAMKSKIVATRQLN
jgi:hypothetical protein